MLLISETPREESPECFVLILIACSGRHKVFEFGGSLSLVSFVARN